MPQLNENDCDIDIFSAPAPLMEKLKKTAHVDFITCFLKLGKSDI